MTPARTQFCPEFRACLVQTEGANGAAVWCAYMAHIIVMVSE